MAHREAIIIEELERLRSLTSSDFIALAPLHDNAQRIRWKYVLGSRNERYQQMVIKSGQGLAGSVLRLGRWVKLDDSHPDSDQVRGSCPVVLAEQLQTAAVFPIMTDSDTNLIKGLLFIGKRTLPRYAEAELRGIQEGLPTLAWYLKENTGEIVK